jgi:parallel beta-helix repeat protein
MTKGMLKIIPAFIALLMTLSMAVHAAQITVCSSGCDNTTIQDGIDFAGQNDTVFVFNGTYHESLVIDKPINLRGEDRKTTIIDGIGAWGRRWIVINVSTSNVNISGFAIRNGFNGITLTKSNNGNINDTIVFDNVLNGITLNTSNNNNITNNTIVGNLNGISISGSTGNRVYNNHFNSILANAVDDSNKTLWNTTKVLGVNIISGPNLGGNFWANPEGNGFSEVCTDADTDGICDNQYFVSSNIIDNLPLASGGGQSTLRAYGSKDLTAPIVYSTYQQPFNPAVIPSDSITFNPAIIQWDGINFTMSANSVNIDVKKFLRAWYEPAHLYKGGLGRFGPHPTVLLESTYILVDSVDKNPISGTPSLTTFAFPLAEAPGQTGLGSFDADGDGAADMVNLVLVNGTTIAPYWETTNGTIAIERLFEFDVGESVRFLDHALTLESVDEDIITGNPLCQVNVTYLGNLDDDSTVSVLLGLGNNYFDRHNNRFTSATHPETTWFARPVAVSRVGSDVRCKIVIGKEISRGDTFYVNGLRYDVPAVEVIDSDGDEVADRFNYITLRTPICKGDGTIDDESIVSSQEINCVPSGEDIPLNPPFNQDKWDMIDDINIPEFGDAYARNPGEHAIHPIYDEVIERIIEGVPVLSFSWVEEDREPRLHTNLLERLKETFIGILPPLARWEFFHIQTEPSNYTEFDLPQMPDIDQTKKGDYLLTSSAIAPNSVKYWHEIKGFGANKKLSKAPRVAFTFDKSDGEDVYINEDLLENSIVRIYGEGDIGPSRVYEKYWKPFDPVVIPKDSVTFNPALIEWDPINFTMSADSVNIDVKKFLRMWYEPQNRFNGPLRREGPHPTITLESTYVLVSRSGKDPVIGSVGSTTFAFPLAEKAGQLGLGTFDADGDGRVDLVKLAMVEGDTPVPFWKTTKGTIAIENTFDLEAGESVRFLDHALTLESVDEGLDGKPYCQARVSYLGNYEDDSARSVLLGDQANSRPDMKSYFDRHNNKKFVAEHPTATWYARALAVSRMGETPVRCKISVGKELQVGDTFYVNGLRYDVPAVEVVDTTNDTSADEFGYITIRTPLCKDVNGLTERIRENSVVTSQWIRCVSKGFPLPLNPPFNTDHKIVDDIDISEDTAHDINPVYEAVKDRIIDNAALEIIWTSENRERRFHTNLLEILDEKYRGNKSLPPLASWDWYHVQTMPDLYTEFSLPPDSLHPLTDDLHNDYLITTSWYALNSLLYRHDIDGPAKFRGKEIPRFSFLHDGNESTGLYINE